ncbi:MAG: right-handed parallel beta-helix repeat-containing protein [Anaerolineae bacterium]|nr:right-handed parallel beta-helix repeat-containing protein [Anaerolineae bacterium]
MTNSTFSNNTAIDKGGAISSGTYSATLAVSNSTFTNNSAAFGGAIAQIADDTISVTTISNSTFSGNSATYGGAIYKYYGVVTVSNSTFSGNSAPNTGGIYAGTYHGTMTVSNSTFSGNLGGSIRDWGPYLAGNLFDAGATGDNCIIIDAIADNGYNLSDDASCGFSGTGSANNATLNLSALSVTPTPGQQVHTPTDPSDAIGAIPYGTTINNNGATLACNQTTTDQLGADRPITPATACTAGAVEVAMPPVCPSWTVTTAAELSDCINLANADESPGPTADTITLGANITLTAALPPIASAITLDGAHHVIDGGGSVRIFTVNSGGDFTVNQATLQNGSATEGAGIFNDGTLTVTDSTVSGNAIGVGGLGGGIHNAGVMMVTNSTFSGNTAGYASNGGGISNEGALTVTNSTFSDNNGGSSGGGIYNKSGGTLTVIRSTFSGNLTGSVGGGISNYSTATVTNSTFSGNSASNFGGGIYNDGPLTVTNSTFADNEATSGGGVQNYSTAHLAGTIFVAGPTGANCTNSGTLTDNGYNLSDDASCGFSGTSADNATLNLDVLADNGGPTWTHALLPGSDALNAIPYGATISNNGVLWTCNDADTFTDQRGVARPQGVGCESGAYELDTIQEGPDFIVNTDADTDDGLCSVLGQGIGNQDCTLREAINAANANADPSEIAFAGDYTITLTAQLPFIATEIIVNGAGRSVTVDGNNTHTALSVLPDSALTLNSLTLAHGYDMVINFGDLTVLNSTLRDGTGEVGGIYSGGSQLIVANSTFYNNQGTNTGAIQADGGTTVINNVTFSGNSGGLAGGMYTYFRAVTITNSIITNSTGGDCVTDGGSFSGSNNLIDDNAAGACSGVSSAAVTNLAATPADNGGDTHTIALLDGSNAIDAGDNATCEATDQRGMSRPFGDGCDIGAVEAQPMCSTIDIQTGWNMVSLPVLPADASVATLFPNTTSPAYAYQNGYVEVSVLELGQSYWLKFDADETVSVCGQSAPVSNSIAVSAGWNMIGIYDSSVAVGDITRLGRHHD